MKTETTNASAPAGAHSQWLDCGNGTLLHPVTLRPITTSVVEQKDWGRVFEVYDYSNNPEGNFRLILAAPELLATLTSLAFQASHHLQDGQRGALVQNEVRNALAAIAKATGAQP